MNRPRSYWNDDEPVIVREVHEAQRDDFTGLYDQNGDPLYRQREPIGFDPHRWSRAMPNPNQKPPKKKKGR